MPQTFGFNPNWTSGDITQAEAQPRSLEAALAAIPGLGSYLAMEQYARNRGQADQAREIQQQFLSEREALGDSPTPEQMTTLGARYSGPQDLYKIGQGSLDRQTQVAATREAALGRLSSSNQMIQMRADENQRRSEDRALDRASRDLAARNAEALRRQGLEVQREIARMRVAGTRPPTGYRYTESGDLEAIPGGPKDTSAKDAARLSAAETKAKLVVDKVDQALAQTGFFTTGLTGTVLGAIPGTPAYSLDKTIDTIKANVGFGELQAMREASPTGGALGAIAVQELNMLQAVIASLDKGQDQAQLRRSLNEVKAHYNNWKATLQRAAPAGVDQQDWDAMTPSERALFK